MSCRSSLVTIAVEYYTYYNIKAYNNYTYIIFIILYFTCYPGLYII